MDRGVPSGRGVKRVKKGAEGKRKLVPRRWLEGAFGQSKLVQSDVVAPKKGNGGTHDVAEATR